jgi:hypothetical protein
MVSNPKSLEDKIDWKQWIPVAGIYFAIKDGTNNRPSLAKSEDLLIFHGSAVYQSLSLIGSILAASYLAYKISH